MIIVLDTQISLGDIVSKAIDDEHIALMVTGFVIHAIDDSGQVVYYSVLCSDGDGNIIDFKPYELKKQETY